ncbi:MAG: hypothetical protein HZA19_06775 [Nitrospirae bacterium]|nr:hypothetical protein [Nitrospirota bacterium]
MSNRRRLLTIVVLCLLIGGAVWLYRVFSDDMRIEGILRTAEEAVEREDAETLSEMISLTYQDSTGMTPPRIRELLSNLFEEFDHFEVVSDKPVIRMTSRTAEARFPLRILVDWAAQRSYLVGRNTKPADVKISFRKEGMHWKVIRVEGLK